MKTVNATVNVTKKTVNNREKNRVNNSTKRNSTKAKQVYVQVVKEEKKQAEKKQDKVIYLAEGVTGKQVMKSIYNANNEHKKDIASFSQCLKRAIEFNQFEGKIKNFNVTELTPKTLLPFRSKTNEGKEKFSVYEVLMMIKKFYQAK
jgi:hypothetical protein